MPTATVLPEPGTTGLNAALQAGLAYAQEHGAADVLILPADVPLATADELRRILDEAHRHLAAPRPARALPRRSGHQRPCRSPRPAPWNRASDRAASCAISPRPWRTSSTFRSCSPRASLSTSTSRAIWCAFSSSSKAREGMLSSKRTWRSRGTRTRPARTRNMSVSMQSALAAADAGRRLTSAEALALADGELDMSRITAAAERLCLAGHGTHVSFSRKVFIPLTHLCRDVCHYCTFAHAPRSGEPAYLSPEPFSLSPARAGRPAARRRCSRWATSPSGATPRRVARSPSSASTRPLPIWNRRRRWCSRRRACCRTSIRA